MDRVYCPYCNNEADAEFVHNGVALERVSPYYCGCCGSREITVLVGHAQGLTQKEIHTGWYEPKQWWPDPS